ncbi:conjugal transfer protein TraL [Neisseria dumasiana]|uniref:Conjugal transfer protein TraL n=1 Tax=Neisseria dumasiana TaxID=1931275 RepID=A0A1X3DEN6_9NEIS|nr:conjugal transfer protein TraL [Neisseria dumasiana]OSI18383.1 conjugal transfer protein TraL [Neisseria dumasiana]
MKEVHLVIQGKGGVGKSFTSAIIADYMEEVASAKIPVFCYDTDPVNRTFSRHKKLKTDVIDIMTEFNTIDSARFDRLIEELVEKDGIGIVDNGAATFVPLMAYLTENRVPELLKDSGVRLILHVPMNGGQAFFDCADGLDKVLTSIKSEVVVWLNDHKGKVEYNGKPFTEFQVYKNNLDRIIGIVHIENRNPDTYGKDIERMTSLSLTLSEAVESDVFTLMPRQRLKNVKRDLFAQIAALPIWVNNSSKKLKTGVADEQ